MVLWGDPLSPRGVEFSWSLTPRRRRCPIRVELAGVSLRTQELYLIVFLTRYLDLFFSFISL